MKAPSETSYLSSFIPPLGPLWVLLMGLPRYIIYAAASDTTLPDTNLAAKTPHLRVPPAAAAALFIPRHRFIKTRRDKESRITAVLMSSIDRQSCWGLPAGKQLVDNLQIPNVHYNIWHRPAAWQTTSMINSKDWLHSVSGIKWPGLIDFSDFNLIFFFLSVFCC